MASTVTVELPDLLYQRLVNTAQVMQCSLEEVILRTLTVGSPPDWANVPAEFQADLAALDRLEDEALWVAARAERTEAEMVRDGELLELKQEQGLSEAEVSELAKLREDADRFMLRKAHAAALLRWRDLSQLGIEMTHY
jgi:hypothetical protein